MTHFSSNSNPDQSQEFQKKDGLEQDIYLLRWIIADPHVKTSVKDAAKRKIERLEPLCERLVELEKQGKQLGIEALCQTLDNRTLAFLVADVVRNNDVRDGLLYKILHEAVKSFFLQKGWLPNWKFHSLVHLWFDLFGVALGDEVGRRQRLNEDASGRPVRELLVEESARGKLLTKLGKQVRWKLWLPEEPEDTASMAVEKIWEDVYELGTVSPVAANPDALLAFVQGRLNKTFGRARDAIRNRIETERRRAEVMEPDPSVLDNLDERKDSAASLNQKLLVEQIVSRAGPTEAERGLLAILFSEGYTQTEAADKLGVSQGEVSKRFGSIRKKLQEAT